jgi:GNAT superfamily N-acetyltransferase
MAQFLPAGPGDEGRILALMEEFYALERLPWDERIARRALRELLGNPALGRVLRIDEEGAAAGYAVLTFGFSLEFRGRNALVDELFVREPHRGRGLGTECLRRLEAICRAEGIFALRLEVDRANERAKRLYLRAGYRDHDRHLLTKPVLDQPCPPS